MSFNLGRIGEDIACSYLIHKGYFVIERNFRSKYGEIDIICRHKRTIIFIEVKTRSDIQSGYPYEAVDQAKQAKIVKAAFCYLNKYSIPYTDIRVDVISIVTQENFHAQYSLSHYQNILSIDD